MKKIFLTLLIFFPTVLTVTGQFRIEGVVTDSGTNEGLPGAYVATRFLNIGTMTDMNSRFILESDKKIDSLTVTFIGYKTIKIPVKGSLMHISLEQSSNELNQVVISARRENQRRVNAPMAVALLPAKVIDETKATEISQLLNKVSGLLISDFGSENHSVSIRQPLSFIRTQLVTLEDEIPVVPGTIASSGNLKELNMAAIRSVEVLKGPASSIYGSEAIGGTINFITKKPPLMPAASVALQANDMGYKRIDFDAGSTFDKLGIFAGGYFAQSSDSYRDYCDFNKASLLLKGIYSLSNDLKMTATVNYIHHKAHLSGGLDSTLFYTNDRYNQYKFCYSDLTSLRANSRIDKIWSNSDKTFFTLYFRRSSEDQIPTYYIQRVWGGPPPARFKGEFIESAYSSYGVIVQHRHTFRFLEAQLIAGLSADYTPFDYTSSQIDVTREEDMYTSYSLTDTYIQDFKADLFNSAGYLVFELSPLRKLKLTSALRYDRLDYYYRNNLPPNAISGADDDENKFDHLSPKLGINYNMNDNTGIYGNYSIGFAPPMFSQLYKAVKVPLLKPSNYSNYEVGGWLSFNGDKGYLDISMYQSDGRNEIVSVMMADGTTQNQSTGETMHRGVEYSVRYNFYDQVEARINAANSIHKFISYVYENNDFSGNFMTQAPKFIANCEITYRPKFLKDFRFGIEWQKTGKYWIDELNTREYAGHDILNLRTGYKIGSFNIWMNILNLENDLYAVRVSKSSYGTRAISYVPGQRRSVYFGVEFSPILQKRKRTSQ